MREFPWQRRPLAITTFLSSTHSALTRSRSIFLTREAVELYLSKLKQDGILLFHISNRYFDLSTVLGQAATRLMLTALIQHDVNLSELEARDGKVASRWVIMARAKELLSPFLDDPRWQRLNGQSQGALWTDDYSNILRVLRWQ